ncbi:MAG: hypothetical protein ACE5IY_21460 [bacterium]
MLHILNGDGIAVTFRKTGLPGTVLPWREALVCGPAPANVSGDKWIRMRASHLSEAYGQPFDTCRKSLIQMEESVRSTSDYDEVVLWFESDLFCQVNLLYVLHLLAQQELRNTSLTLICIDAFAEVEPFYGLGQLNHEQLASLFNERQTVSPATLRLAGQAWRAYTSPNPQTVQEFLQKDTTPLPFIKAAFQAHLARFPSVHNGLGRIEHAALDLIVGGVDEFKPLFPMFRELYPVYGLGDAQFWNHLRFMSELGTPLLNILDLEQPGSPFSGRGYDDGYFRLTEAGKAVLVGNSDNLNLNKIDIWLGGVHLKDENPLWRWDEQTEQLRRES